MSHSTKNKEVSFLKKLLSKIFKKKKRDGSVYPSR